MLLQSSKLAQKGSRFPTLAWPSLVGLHFLLLWLNIVGFIIMAFLRNINTYDESVSLTIARGILDILTPYVDLWDTKPPGTYYALAAVMALFGTSWWVPRLLMIVGLSVVFLLMWMMRNRVSPASAVWATCLLVVGLMAKGGYRVDTYMLAGAFVVLGTVLVYGEAYTSLKSHIIFGLCAGIATTFNQIGLLYFVGFLVAANINQVVFRFPYITLAALIKTCVALLAYLIPLALMIFYLGTIDSSAAFIDAAYSQPSQLTQAVMAAPWQSKLFFQRLLGAPVHLITMALFGTWLVSILLFRQDRLSFKMSRDRLTQAIHHPHLLIVLLAFFGMISPIMRYGNPHWISSTFFFAFIAALLLEGIEINLWGMWRQLLRPMAFLGLLGISLIAWVGGPLQFIRETPLYEDLQQGEEVWHAIGQCLEPSDPILAISATSPRLYYLLQRYPPWRYLYVDESNYGLVSWHNDVVAMIENSPPKAVALEVHQNSDRILERGPGPLAMVDEYVTYAHFRELLAQKYRKIPLAHGQDAMHEANLELYVLNELNCRRVAEPYPLVIDGGLP